MGKVRAVWKWVRGHKRKVCCWLGVLLLVVYGVVYLYWEFWPSPADKVVSGKDGRKVAYLEKVVGNGEGAVVVLVHGSPTDCGSWLYYLRKTRVEGVGKFVAVDRFNFGQSGRVEGYELEEQAKVVKPFLEEGRKVVLVGHSYGGPVVLRAAADYGDRVAGIVIVAGACDPEMKDPKWFRGMVDGVRFLLPGAWGESNAELYALNEENRKMKEVLGKVKCPVVVVHGEWDGVCPVEGNVGYLRRALGDVERLRVRRLERTGHQIHLTDWEEIDGVIGWVLGGGS